MKNLSQKMKNLESVKTEEGLCVKQALTSGAGMLSFEPDIRSEDHSISGGEGETRNLSMKQNPDVLIQNEADPRRVDTYADQLKERAERHSKEEMWQRNYCDSCYEYDDCHCCPHCQSNPNNCRGDDECIFYQQSDLKWTKEAWANWRLKHPPCKCTGDCICCPSCKLPCVISGSLNEPENDSCVNSAECQEAKMKDPNHPAWAKDPLFIAEVTRREKERADANKGLHRRGVVHTMDSIEDAESVPSDDQPVCPSHLYSTAISSHLYSTAIYGYKLGSKTSADHIQADHIRYVPSDNKDQPESKFGVHTINGGGSPSKVDPYSGAGRAIGGFENAEERVKNRTVYEMVTDNEIAAGITQAQKNPKAAGDEGESAWKKIQDASSGYNLGGGGGDPTESERERRYAAEHLQFRMWYGRFVILQDVVLDFIKAGLLRHEGEEPYRAQACPYLNSLASMTEDFTGDALKKLPVETHVLLGHGGEGRDVFTVDRFLNQMASLVRSRGDIPTD